MVFRQIEPQKARGTFNEALWANPDWFVEEKHDGDRRIAQVLEEGVRFTGCRKSVDGSGFVEKTANVPHLAGRPGDALYRVRPRGLIGTVLDGEMVPPPDVKIEGGQSKYVTSIMGSLPDVAIQKQRDRGWLHYVVFDVLYYQGRDVRMLPYTERRNLAAKCVALWSQGTSGVRLVEAAEPRTGRAFYEEIIARGGEGVILKHRDGTYGDPRQWVKVKKEATADAFIVGYRMARHATRKSDGRFTKAKYAGKVGSVKIAQYKSGGVVIVGHARGFDDATMRRLTEDPAGHIDAVVEIRHNGREPTGKFRHPRVVRFRPDKEPNDCVMRKGEV